MACSGQRYSQRIFPSEVWLDHGQGLQTHTWIKHFKSCDYHDDYNKSQWQYDDDHMTIWWWSYDDMMMITWQYDDDHMTRWWWSYDMIWWWAGYHIISPGFSKISWAWPWWSNIWRGQSSSTSWLTYLYARAHSILILILEYGCLSVCLCPSVTKRPQRVTHYSRANTLSKC